MGSAVNFLEVKEKCQSRVAALTVINNRGVDLYVKLMIHHNKKEDTKNYVMTAKKITYFVEEKQPFKFWDIFKI